MATPHSSQSSRRVKFSTLEPRVRHVSKTTIRKKWKKLPPIAQDKVKQMLLDLKQQARVNGMGNKKTKSRKKMDDITIAELEGCVEEVAAKLMARLPRMPFPPSTDDQQFDFEATLQRIQTLESQLNSNMESMNLLRTQIAKEQRQLVFDRQEVEQLNQALKASESLKKKQERSLHPIAKNLDMNVISEQSIDQRLIRRRPTSISALEDDSEIGVLLGQLRSHLESMQNNTASLRPVAEAVDEAQFALDRFVHQNWDQQHYNTLFGLDGT